MGLEWLRVSDPLPEVAGTYRGDVIVACPAKCLWEDLERVPNRSADILCVNDAAFRFPGQIEHVYSSHAEVIAHYRALRREAVRTHTIAASRKAGEADFIWPWPGHGTSGLNAIYTALALGYERVSVCGQPMDNSGHITNGPPGHWLEARHPWGVWSNYGDRKNYKVWEKAIANVFDGRVTFMSGRFA